MLLAGLPAPDARVLKLAGRLDAGGFHDLADRLDDAWRGEIKVFALGVEDREAILRVLEDGPVEFAELRGVFLRSTSRGCARDSAKGVAQHGSSGGWPFVSSVAFTGLRGWQ